SEQKKYRSARGKASLNKAMLLLEKTVVDKIRNSVGEEQPEVDEKILEALREAEEQRQVEILAARYAEQRKKITKAELDLLGYIREHGEEKARALLESQDIPDQEWDRLVIRARQTGKGAGPGSGPGAGAGPGGNTGGGAGQGSGDHVDMGALAIVLDKLEDIMSLDNMPPEIIGSAVEEVRDTANEVSSQVENEISKIEAKIAQHETECRENPDDPANQKKRGDILLEISQLALKLTQPLTVISASIDGAMNPGNSGFQKDLLDMAQEAAETMKKLMDRLTALVGFPSMQEADQNINLYD
ncbi:MAG TPA: hypothetical protein VJ904_10025, partial [Tichowtungia sp.]|nr:hypothetical protein [Tichowtungia sp.]